MCVFRILWCPGDFPQLIMEVVILSVDIRTTVWYNQHHDNVVKSENNMMYNKNSYLYSAALVVRFLTRRFIWEYDPTLGKTIRYLLVILWPVVLALLLLLYLCLLQWISTPVVAISNTFCNTRLHWDCAKLQWVTLSPYRGEENDFKAICIYLVQKKCWFRLPIQKHVHNPGGGNARQLPLIFPSHLISMSLSNQK